MPVADTDGLLFGMELDVEASKAELRELAGKGKGVGAGGFLNSMGLGAIASQLDDLALGAPPATPRMNAAGCDRAGEPPPVAKALLAISRS